MFTYPILEVLKVYDGDSVTLRLDLGFRLSWSGSCRVDGVDTPEVRGGIATAESKAAAYLARDFVRAWLEEALAEPGWTGLYFESHDWDKFGRALGHVIRQPKDGPAENLSTRLVNEHLAVLYHGQNKADVSRRASAQYRLAERSGLAQRARLEVRSLLADDALDQVCEVPPVYLYASAQIAC